MTPQEPKKKIVKLPTYLVIRCRHLLTPPRPLATVEILTGRCKRRAPLMEINRNSQLGVAGAPVEHPRVRTKVHGASLEGNESGIV